jgi:hypothetical protein
MGSMSCAPICSLHPLNVMLRYRDRLVVEHLFRSEKALLATRPIYHQTAAAIRGHVFCSFLAVVLRKELEERLTAARLKPEWRELLADLDRLQEIEVEQDGKHFILRTPVTGVAGKARQAVGAGGTAAKHPRSRSSIHHRLIIPLSRRQCSAN